MKWSDEFRSHRHMNRQVLLNDPSTICHENRKGRGFPRPFKSNFSFGATIPCYLHQNLSSSMTLAQAATKSFTNFSFASPQA